MAENGQVYSPIKRGGSSSEIIKQFNISNAKLLALVLVVFLVAYHAVLKSVNGNESCEGLLTKGRYQGNDFWQPYGCMSHSFTQQDATECLRRTSFLGGKGSYWAFVGDSRMRQLYFEVLKMVDPAATPLVVYKDDVANYFDHVMPGDDQQHQYQSANDERPLEKAHKSLTYNNTQLSFRMTFFWRPVFNRSATDLFRHLSQTLPVPGVVVAGSGVWNIKLLNGSRSEASFDAYANDLELVAQALGYWPNKSTKLLWKPQDPVDVSKLSESRRMITNELIDEYNAIAFKVLRRSRFRIWNSARMVTNGMETGQDGLHLSSATLKHHVQILMNMYCNERMDFEDGTCCRPPESATTLQIITFSVLFVCLTVTVTWTAYHRFRFHFKRRLPSYTTVEDDEVIESEDSMAPLVGNGHGHVANGNPVKPPSRQSTAKDEPSYLVAVTALGKLGLIMAYFYLCDRTTFFMNENKYFSHLNFWVPIGYVFVLGLFFNEESRSTRLLHRDQTDEWKGWMQLVILIYHMTGASRIIPLYMQMRILVSSYLFLTGFGHLSFFWNGGSASFSRLFQVLFRMNLMTVVICLCMNRPYQSYYFVPLVSFWYLVVYIVLSLPPKVSATICETKPIAYLYIVLKFIGLFVGITVLSLSEVFFEDIFLSRPWKALFVTSNDEIHEWWFRWSLDRYSICFGMIFGFLYLNGQKFGLIDDSTRQHLLNGRLTRWSVLLAAVLGLGGYTVFTVTCHSKPECNEVHSYLAFIPIVSFILLRNIFGPLRVRYSSFFAWFGRISLELFIGQYHIWLAADTHGVLVLVPNYPVLNVIVTTFILVCVAHEVHTITGQLVAVAVPADWKKALRNVVLFFLILMPIAIHDGMF